MSLLDLVIIVLSIGFGIILVDFTPNAKVNRFHKNKLLLLWAFHLVISVAFYFLIQGKPADVKGYWYYANLATPSDLEFYISSGPGTKFMYVLNYIPANILELSFFSGVIFYAFLSFIGFYCFYRLCLELIPYNTKFIYLKIFPLIFFLPSLHFWSSGPGKDTLMFMIIGIFGFALLNFKKRIILLLVSLLLGLMVRPHIIVMLLTSFGIIYLISSNLALYSRILIFIILISISGSMMPFLMDYANIDSASIDSVVDRFETQSGKLSGSNIGSSINIQSYPYPLKILTFVFRPLFFDYSGILSLFSSFENLIILIFFIRFITFRPILSIKSAPLIIKGYLLFFVIGVLVFSFYMSNLGIISRMKNMFLPGFIIFLLYSFSYKHESKNNESISVHPLVS